jgi:MFS family permease
MSLPSDEGPKTTLSEDLRELARSPRELWLVYAATFFEYLGVYSFLSTLKFWLSSDHGMSDTKAGWWAATFSTLTTMFLLLVGPISDSIGVRTMLIVSFALAAVTRLGMSLAPDPTLAVAALLAFAFAFATSGPVLQTAVNRASSKNARAFAFTMWYVSFNFAGWLVGFIIDDTRAYFRDATTHQLVHKTVHLPILGDRLMSAHAAILMLGFVFAAIAAVIVLFIRADFGEAAMKAKAAAEAKAWAAKQAEESGAYRAPDAPEVPEPPKPPRPNPLKVLGEVLSDKAFWRFMVLLVLLALVKLIFQHMHFTWPTYVTRMEGDAFPVGKVWSLNSFLILFLAPIGTAATRKYKALDVLLIGAFITAASPLVLCLGSSLPFQLTMIVTLTIGEALWSPRLYEYNLSVAPKGRESTYISLAALPYFVAKLLVGPSAGALLPLFVPEHGPRNPAALWAIISGVTLLGPIGILFARKWITRKEEPATVPAAA